MGKTRFYALTLGISVGLAAASLAALRSQTNTSSQMAPASNSPVLLELFTSEGCSSCPPAEALLLMLDNQGDLRGIPVIVFEEHVDYWDHLGWKDPYSSAQWTTRQQNYAAALKHDSIYTPQLVVDGWDDVVGSREAQVLDAVVASSRRPKANIELQARNDSPTRADLRIVVHSLPPEETSREAGVWLAVTERGLHGSVTRGENAGKDLYHSEVLRSLRRVGSAHRGKEPSYSGEHTIHLDPGWKRANLRFIVFVQDKDTMRILGAEFTALPQFGP